MTYAQLHSGTIHPIIHWARRVLAEDCLILDTETTGVRDAEIVEIGVVDAHGNTALHTLVKPVHRIPARVTEIHGITNAMVADAPRWNTVVQQVETLFHGRTVVIYNASFDTAMLVSSTRIAGCAPVSWHRVATFECAMRQYAAWRGGRWQKLGLACTQMRVPEPSERAHSAIGDCLRTLGLLRAMAAHGSTG